jgi:HlyD family secretion protein
MRLKVPTFASARHLVETRAKATVQWARRHPRRAAVAAGGLLVLLIALFALVRSRGDDALVTVVRRGNLVVRLTETGTLRPAESITYRAPLNGRELEVTFLVPEGTRVNEGDLLVRLDTSDLESELRRTIQEQRQAQMDLQAARAEAREAAADLEALDEGEGSVAMEETLAALRVAEKKVQRLKSDHDALTPLMAKGYITRDEIDKAAFELEQAEAELQLARKKTDVFVKRTRPRERERARAQLAEKQVLEANVQPRLEEAASRAEMLQEAIQNCAVYAERPGLVVYEEYLASSPRRKVRVGDRVTRSQGLITIPEVDRMIVESSVDEASVHKVRPGQVATIQPDAFPNLRLTGKVSRVGTLARSSIERPFDDKRFDLIIDVGGSHPELRPEMTARVDVIVSERPNVLLLPVNAVFEVEGLQVAHVAKTFGRETRQIELGESNEFFVEILAGLREGERVTLTDVGAPEKPEAAAFQGKAGELGAGSGRFVVGPQ